MGICKKGRRASLAHGSGSRPLGKAVRGMGEGRAHRPRRDGDDLILRQGGKQSVYAGSEGRDKHRLGVFRSRQRSRDTRDLQTQRT
jgi:hypothetical protein